MADGVNTEPYDDTVNPRRHGLVWPLETAQMTAWGNILLLFIIWWTLHAPFMPFPASVTLSAFFFIGTVTVVVLKFVATLKQTADDGVGGEIVYTPENFLHLQAPEGKILCVFCKTFVTEDCKHCRTCDKCVVGFDHHCMWLGACVGVKTYRTFFAFCVCTFFLLVFQMGCGFWLFGAAIMDPEEYMVKVRRIHNHSNVAVYQAFTFLFALYEACGACTLGNLILFHIYLSFSKQSTYQWILKRREEKKAYEAAGKKAPSFWVSVCCPSEPPKAPVEMKQTTPETNA